MGSGVRVMGGAYFICGVIPALFIRDKQCEPQKLQDHRRVTN